MLPATYELVVHHDFGESATVTVDYRGWKINPADGVLTYDAVQTPINAVSVPDNTDQGSGNIDNDTNKHYGLHGNMSVQGTTLTGTCNLYLKHKDGVGSDTELSWPLASVSFTGENGPRKVPFEA